MEYLLVKHSEIRVKVSAIYKTSVYLLSEATVSQMSDLINCLHRSLRERDSLSHPKDDMHFLVQTQLLCGNNVYSQLDFI